MVIGRDVVDRVARLRNETTTLFWNDIVGEELTDEEVARLWLSISAYQTAVNAAVKVVGDEWVRRFQDRNCTAIEVDGFLVVTKKGYTKESCIDSDGFLSWLAQNPGMVPAVVAPNSVKFGSLPPAVRQTFFSKEDVVKPDTVEKPAAIPLDVLEQIKAKKLAHG